MSNELGKRYICGVCGTEALCTKAGEGAVECDAQPMRLQEARKLPASD